MFVFSGCPFRFAWLCGLGGRNWFSVVWFGLVMGFWIGLIWVAVSMGLLWFEF